MTVKAATARGDFHGNVEAVREANTEDPHREIYEGPPAVTTTTS